ncbi:MULTISPECIES: hypothetical protein [Desulfobacula]|uniref:hypothetical protein n=1 Tax=Desulfobacula TaxID=28222 RepID=UPI00059BD3A8|nr:MULTISPECIES: hypothetical protein [Desulfobacula]
MEIDWKEVIGYVVGFFSWVYGKLPNTCDGWTDLIAFLTVTVTFVFITMPKAWDFQKKWWGKR